MRMNNINTVETRETYPMSVSSCTISFEHSVAFIDIPTVHPLFLPTEWRTEITKVTITPIETTTLLVAATMGIILGKWRKLHVTIDQALCLTFTSSETGIRDDISHVSACVRALHSLEISRKAWRFLDVATATTPIALSVSFPSVAALFCIGVPDLHWGEIILFTLILALVCGEAGVVRVIPNVSVQVVQVTMNPHSRILKT